MNNDIQKIKIVTSAFLAAAIVTVFVVIITIFAELYMPLKDWLKINFSHHWIGKGVLSAVLFIALFIALMFKNPYDKSLTGSVKIAFWLAIVSAAAIFIFYFYEVLFVH